MSELLQKHALSAPIRTMGMLPLLGVAAAGCSNDEPTPSTQDARVTDAGSGSNAADVPVVTDQPMAIDTPAPQDIPPAVDVPAGDVPTVGTIAVRVAHLTRPQRPVGSGVPLPGTSTAPIVGGNLQVRPTGASTAVVTVNPFGLPAPVARGMALSVFSIGELGRTDNRRLSAFACPDRQPSSAITASCMRSN